MYLLHISRSTEHRLLSTIQRMFAKNTHTTAHYLRGTTWSTATSPLNDPDTLSCLLYDTPYTLIPHTSFLRILHVRFPPPSPLPQKPIHLPRI